MFAQLSHQLLCEFFPRYEIVVKNSYLFGQLCFSADKAIFTLLCVNKQIKTFRDIINSQLYCIRRFFFVRIRNASNCDEQKMPTIQTHFSVCFTKSKTKSKCVASFAVCIHSIEWTRYFILILITVQIKYSKVAHQLDYTERGA